GVFHENRYFDVFVEYAKADVEDILIKITATNRGPETAALRVLPTIWFRNTWSWGDDDPCPEMHKVVGGVELDHPTLGKRWLYGEGAPELLFTENETNYKRLFGVENSCVFVKDGINDYIVNGRSEAVAAEPIGTKAAAHYKMEIPAGASVTIRMRLTDIDFSGIARAAFDGFDKVFLLRKSEADDFYRTVVPHDLSSDARNVMRQSFAGMLWSKQFYHYEL